MDVTGAAIVVGSVVVGFAAQVTEVGPGSVDNTLVGILSAAIFSLAGALVWVAKKFVDMSVEMRVVMAAATTESAAQRDMTQRLLQAIEERRV